MSLVSCPKCGQQLDITGMQPETVIQCPCGVRLKTPAAPAPSVAVAPAAIDPANDPFGLGNLPVEHLAPQQYPPNQAPANLAPTNPAQNNQIPAGNNGQGMMQPQAYPPQMHNPHSQPAYPPNAYSQAAPQQIQSAKPASAVEKFNKGIRFITYSIIIGVAIHFLSILLATLVIFDVITAATWAFGLLRFLHLISGAGIGLYVYGLIQCNSLTVNPQTQNFLYLSIGSSSLSILFELGVVFSPFFLLFGFAPAIGPMVASGVFLHFLRLVLEEKRQNKKAEEVMQLIYFVGAIAAVWSSAQSLPGTLSIIVIIGAMSAYFMWAILFIKFLYSLDLKKRASTKTNQNTGQAWGNQR